MNDDARRRIFLEIHSGLPREAPRHRASTARALQIAQPLPERPFIVDVGCGPGAQTLDLAALVPDARIVGIDAHAPFVEALRRRAEAAGIAQRVAAQRGDMRALPFAARSIDLLWCEGAAYVVGVPKALELWAPLVKAGGRIALTEAVWLKNPAAAPEAVRRNWAGYPAMTDVAGNRAIVARAGLKLLGDFTLPADAWWDYYGPLEARAHALASKYAGDALAEAVLADTLREVDAYRRHGDWFGYQFFVIAAS